MKSDNYLKETVYIDVEYDKSRIPVGTMLEYVTLDEEETVKKLYRVLNGKRPLVNYLGMEECAKYARKIRNGILGEYISEMATLCQFNGMIINMKNEAGESHNDAHFHVWYSGGKCSIDLNGNIRAGSLPSPQLGQIRKWITLHRNELKTAWNTLINGNKPDKIPPL